VEDVVEEDGAILVWILGFKSDGTSPDGKSWEVLAKAFYSEGRNILVLFEDGVVVEDVAVGSRVVVAWVVMEESVV
jgi:hypothetical protein